MTQHSEHKPVYGVCPNGHGDENGIIAPEESYAAREYPNCPACGHRLKYADACIIDHAWCVGPDGPTVDGEAWGGKCSTCYTEGEYGGPAETRFPLNLKKRQVSFLIGAVGGGVLSLLVGRWKTAGVLLGLLVLGLGVRATLVTGWVDG